MKIILSTILLFSLAGCSQFSNLINQSQSALEKANLTKGLEAREIMCNRLYIKTFQELFGTEQEINAWKVICKDKTEFTP
jgi:hypothetical protein